MSDKYILDESGNPVREDSLMKWAAWYETMDRLVAADTIGQARVSTVFLGLDHSFGDEGPPVLWETMVFGGALDEMQERCSGSREQAETMHREMVERVKQHESVAK